METGIKTVLDSNHWINEEKKGQTYWTGSYRIDFLRFQASASVWLRSALFRVAGPRGSVWHRRPIFKGQYVQGRTSWPLKVGPICCPEMSVTNQPTPWNSSEERRALKNTFLTWFVIAQHTWLPHTHRLLIQAAMITVVIFDEAARVLLGKGK